MPASDRVPPPADACTGERYTKQGHLLTSSRQLLALNALLDTPQASVTSIAEWHALTKRYEEYLHRDTVWNFPESWVTVTRVGPRVIATLGPRGRAILGGHVPVHVHGCGPMDGVRGLLGWRNPKHRKGTAG